MHVEATCDLELREALAAQASDLSALGRSQGFALRWGAEVRASPRHVLEGAAYCGTKRKLVFKSELKYVTSMRYVATKGSHCRSSVSG